MINTHIHPSSIEIGSGKVKFEEIEISITSISLFQDEDNQKLCLDFASNAYIDRILQSSNQKIIKFDKPIRFSSFAIMRVKADLIPSSRFQLKIDAKITPKDVYLERYMANRII